MAVTKILYRNGGLQQAIDYITYPAKTNEQLLTDYVRCDPGYAAQQMMDTKRALGKTAGRQCYHIIQSFKPDEITPELAHEIAKQFAAEHLPGYEAVIATHVDKAHIHSHIVFNSVNAVTGKMYHSTCENYYRQIRGVSDRLCKAHGLSIVLENGEKKAVSYAEWLRQKKGQPTFRSMLEADLHDAIEDANDLGHFFMLMEHAKEVLDTCGIPREVLLAEKSDLYEQLVQVNQQIRQERWKLKQCKEISETAAIMQRDIDRVEQQPQRIADTHQR